MSDLSETIEFEAQIQSQASQDGDKLKSSRTPLIACLAMLLAAPIFALVTWQEDYSFTFARHFSISVVVTEAIVILVGIAGGFQLSPALRALPNLTKFAGLAWVAAALTSSLLADTRPVTAIVLYGSSLLHAIFLLVCWRMFSTSWRPWRALVMACTAIGAAIYFLLILALICSQIDNPSFNWKNFGPGVSNVRQLGFYGLTLAGLSAGFLANATDRLNKLGWAVLLIMGLWLTYLSGSRAAFGAIFLALALLIASTANGNLIASTANGKRLQYSQIVVFCALAAALLSYSIVPDIEWGLNRILGDMIGTTPGVDYSTGRYDMWVKTIPYIGDRPIFGYGEGQFRFAIKGSSELYNHPHNFLLQFLFQWGIAGTIALGLAGLRTARSLHNRLLQAPAITFPAFGAVSALIAMSFLEGSLYHVYPTMIVLLGLAVLSSAPETGVNGDNQETEATVP